MSKTMIYTMQTAKGERGWIQCIKESNGKWVVVDEIVGVTTDLPENWGDYAVITKEDYDIVYSCQQRYLETNNEFYRELVERMMDWLVPLEEKTG